MILKSVITVQSEGKAAPPRDVSRVSDCQCSERLCSEFGEYVNNLDLCRLFEQPPWLHALLKTSTQGGRRKLSTGSGFVP